MDPIVRRPIVAVLGACVLFPFYLRDFMLSTAYYGRLYAPRWSTAILDEVTRNLIGRDRSGQDDVRRLVSRLAAAFPLAEIANPESLIPCLRNHAKDRHVVETALVAHAEVIVTHNLQDFPEADLGPLGLTAAAPDSFLCDIYRGQEQVLPRVLAAQLGHYPRRPLAEQQLIEILRPVIPNTMAIRTGT